MENIFKDFKDMKSKEKLFDEFAKVEANKLISKTKDRNGKEKVNGVSRSQLRRIFDQVKYFKRKLENDKETWDNIYINLKLLKAKTLYSITRAIKNKPSDKKYYKSLENFIEKYFNSLKDEEDFKIFVDFFEAVYAYYYYYGGSETK